MGQFAQKAKRPKYFLRNTMKNTDPVPRSHKHDQVTTEVATNENDKRKKSEKKKLDDIVIPIEESVLSDVEDL